MNKVLELSNEEYVNYQFIKPYNYGDNGKLFQYNKKYLLKLWNEELPFKTLYDFKENIKNLIDSNLSYKSINLPQRIVVVNKRIIGYLIKYFNGNDLEKLDKNILYNYFLKSLFYLEIELKDFSRHGFLLEDMHCRNLMYKESFKGLMICTDPDPWHKAEKFINSNSCYKHNITEINRTIVNHFIDQNLKDFIMCNPNLNKRYQDIQDFVSCELYSFFLDLKTALEKELDIKVKNFDYISKVLSR